MSGSGFQTTTSIPFHLMGDMGGLPEEQDWICILYIKFKDNLGRNQKNDLDNLYKSLTALRF